MAKKTAEEQEKLRRERTEREEDRDPYNIRDTQSFDNYVRYRLDGGRVIRKSTRD